MKIDFVKLTPEELQAIDNVVGEVPTKWGLPIASIIQNAVQRRLVELNAEAVAKQEAEAKEAEQPEFMTPTTEV